MAPRAESPFGPSCRTTHHQLVTGRRRRGSGQCDEGRQICRHPALSMPPAALAQAAALVNGTRTRIRVRTAMAAQTLEQGRYLGGRPPYGYRRGDAGPHPNEAHAA